MRKTAITGKHALLIPFAAGVLLFGNVPAATAAPSAAAERARAQALMRADSFLALAPGADAVVVAEVASRRSYWSPDHKLIFTDVRLATRSRLKGTPPATVALTVEGGEVGDVGLRVSHAPRFEAGASYAVLLERAPGGLAVRGGANGVRRLGAPAERESALRDLGLVLRRGGK